MKRFFLKFLFNRETRRGTWRKLSRLLRHGTAQRDALTLLRDMYAACKHPLAPLFTDVLVAVNQNGVPFDMAFFPWVPHEECMLIRNGVRSGKLADALKDCEKLIEARGKIGESLFSAVTQPAILLVLFFTIILVLALYAIPQFTMLSNPETWYGAAGHLYAFCSFVASPLGLICFLLLVVFLLLSLCSLPFWTGKTRLMVENIPPWSIYRLVVGSVWLFTLATQMRAGIAVDFIITDMIESNTMRPWLAERVLFLKDQSRIDGTLRELLLKSREMKFLDEEMVEELALYATQSDFPQELYNISHEWLQEGVVRIGKQAQILNTTLIGLIIGMVCWLGLAFGSMNEQINSGMGGF